MANNITRILTEAVVKNTLKEIEDSPKRSIRRLVDMALNFSEGRFKNDFFGMAQKMLENENSPYYDLIRDAVTHVDHERILRIGMNVGFNSCTDGPLAEILPLIKDHADSAFVLVCEPDSMTEDFLDSAAQVYNIMPVVRYDEEKTAAFDLMRKKRYLYAAYQTYGDQEAETIANGDLFYSAEQVHAVLTALLPSRDSSEETRKKAAAYVERARNEQMFETIPWEAWYDSCRVDAIISGDACFADFDAQGNLCGPLGEYDAQEAALNIFLNDLAQVFKRAFPKQKESD